ncbi:MAG: tetratricopeptide repeat protein, partial [Ignavibacteria bacterium]|nr:tetratricopeptide repeat protein [Ignavibacteria bacterium]
VYANSLNNEFVFDDESVVLGDQSITSLSNIPKYFTAEQGFHKVIGRYYRPVVSATYAIDYALWGLKPFGFHLTNVLIHVINVLLLFGLLRMMFEKSTSKFKNYGILIGTLIFALHPVHTEAVAWVSGRTDSLSCTFFFASFIYYFKFSKKSSALNLTLTLFFYLFALLAKEMAITLPVMIILYDLMVNKLSIKDALMGKIKIYSALIVLSLAYLLLRWAVLKDIPQRESYFYFYGKDSATTIYTMLQTIPIYFKLAVFPIGMVYHYGGFLTYLSSLMEPGVIFAVVFIFVMGIVTYYLFKRMPVVSYAIIFFFITLLPVLNIVPTMNFMADRFLYIPSVFLSLIAIAVLFKYYTPKASKLIYTITGIVLIVFGYMTIARNAEWKTNDILFMSADGIPGSVLYVNIGNIYANKGQYDAAEKYYRKAIDLRVETILGNNNMGKLFMIKGNMDSAYYYIHKAYLLDSLSPEPMHTMAQLYARNDKIPESVFWLEKLQTVTPNYMNSVQMLQELKARQQMPLQQDSPLNNQVNPKVTMLEGSSYKNYQEKKFDKAIEELTELVKLNPAGASGYNNNIGMCYLDGQKYNDAIKYFEFAVKEKPDFSSAVNNLGFCYERLGDKTNAEKYYRKALELDPNNQLAKDNLSKLK